MRPFDHIETPEQVTIAEIANALAAFQAIEWKASTVPSTSIWLATSRPFTDSQKRGHGSLSTARPIAPAATRVHSLSDQKFHAIGLPPFGPGTNPAVRPDGARRRPDGRKRPSGRRLSLPHADAAKRRADRSLMATTAPTRHLRASFATTLILTACWPNWTPEKAALPDAPWLAPIDFVVWKDKREMARQALASGMSSPSPSPTRMSPILCRFSNRSQAQPP